MAQLLSSTQWVRGLIKIITIVANSFHCAVSRWKWLFFTSYVPVASCVSKVWKAVEHISTKNDKLIKFNQDCYRELKDVVRILGHFPCLKYAVLPHAGVHFSFDVLRQPIAVSDISVYICLIDIRDGSCKPVYGGVDRLKALSSAKTGCRSRFFMN